MKDPRFLPVEKREPVEEYEDEFYETEEELYDILTQGKAKSKEAVKRFELYIAS